MDHNARYQRIVLLGILCAFLGNVDARCQNASDSAPAAAFQQSLLERRYKEGEKISYHMKASNRDREKSCSMKFKPRASSKRAVRPI
jgi:hypothetical protein